MADLGKAVLPIAVIAIVAAAAGGGKKRRGGRVELGDPDIDWFPEDDDVPEDEPDVPEEPVPLGPDPTPGQLHVYYLSLQGNKTIEADDQWPACHDGIFTDVAVYDYSARELTTAEKDYYLRPPDKLFPNLIRTAQLLQIVNTTWMNEGGGRLKISSTYRPWESKKGAHTRAAAIDIDLPQGERTKANEHDLRLLVASMWQDDVNNFSGMGFYKQPRGRVHLETHHPGGKGKRYWHAEHVKPILDELRGYAGRRSSLRRVDSIRFG